MKCDKAKYKYLFGPVNSRRLGISLGIDIIPHKVCSFDCIYCECGKTTELTCKRREFFPVKEIEFEIENFLKTKPSLDYVTLSGSGEPLLFSKFKELARFIKTKFPEYNLALLTNGSLLIDRKIYVELIYCDVVLPSLDAADNKTFFKINRPCKGLDIKDIIEGIKNFRNVYKGKMWLEIFIVPGVNDNNESLKNIKRAVHYIKPDEIHLNSLDRPGTEDFVKALSYESLEEILMFFDYKGKVVSRKDLNCEIENNNRGDLILETIMRRPSTIEDLIKTSGGNALLVKNKLNNLVKE